MTAERSPGKVLVHAVYETQEREKADFGELFQQFLRQVERDVLTGTFDDYHASIFPNKEAYEAFQARSEIAAQCFDESNDEGFRSGKMQFRLELAAELFSDPSYGLQRLVHTLASDIFQRRIPQLRGTISVREVDLSNLRQVYEAEYRRNSHSIADIKKMFRLRQHEPLLAFSFKPRSCLSSEDYLHITRQAFEGGCHIVELDTRDLILRGTDRLDLLRQLTNEALRSSNSRICRFSANVSGPVRVAKEFIEALSVAHALKDATSPWIMKVDGNLDGLSTIQAIRSGQFSVHCQPVITCYPVLKYALEAALGRNAFVKMLAMSGADIIYPGQSPQFPSRGRGIDTERVAAAQRHYKAMDLGGYPMLSVAGGVFINSVHAYLSILGPDIAFFVGGGIALSKKGIKKAAENFGKAIRLAEDDLFEARAIGNLQDRFVDLSRIYFDKDVPPEYEYVRLDELKSLPDRYKSTNLEK